MTHADVLKKPGMFFMTHADVLKKLKDMALDEGSAEAVATRLKISPQYLSDVLKKRRGIGPKLQRALGLKHQNIYTKV